jgi:inhibitor of KinA sporulation pathway (predicted exonuclease)
MFISNDGSLPRNEMEIIEIGAVMQNACTFEIESEFQTFIRPVLHWELTDFCTELTTTTQADVDQAPPFPVALAAMQEWMYQFHDCPFCSWGDYDRHQFVQDCSFHGVGYLAQNTEESQPHQRRGCPTQNPSSEKATSLGDLLNYDQGLTRK